MRESLSVRASIVDLHHRGYNRATAIMSPIEGSCLLAMRGNGQLEDKQRPTLVKPLTNLFVSRLSI